MEVIIEIQPQSASLLSGKELKDLALATIKRGGFTFPKKKLVLSVALVTPSAIQKLNRQYRHKDAATDVLSFGEYPDAQTLKKEKQAEIFLGELVICCAVVKKSAKLNQVSFRNEFSYIFSHGLLHLLGFEHGAKMFAIQDQAVEKIK